MEDVRKLVCDCLTTFRVGESMKCFANYEICIVDGYGSDGVHFNIAVGKVKDWFSVQLRMFDSLTNPQNELENGNPKLLLGTDFPAKNQEELESNICETLCQYTSVWRSMGEKCKTEKI